MTNNIVRNLYNDYGSDNGSDNDSDIVIEADDTETDTDESSLEDDLEFDIEDDPDPYYVEAIYRDDSHHFYDEKTNKKYYIGICKLIRRQNLIVLFNSVSARVFLKHPFPHICDYLDRVSILSTRSTKVHIMQLDILPDNTYSVIIKSHWLRLVQRHWKITFRERNRLLKQRLSLGNLCHREVTGRFKHGYNVLPSIYGMMRTYARAKPKDIVHVQ